MTKPPISARELCDLLGVHSPTSEQEAIIEAPLRGGYRIVAGAGSGKTETMALRVVWLVANGFVRPDEVLGLTFTRKAATELAERISLRLRSLPESRRSERDEFHVPHVATYNSFASRIYQDFGVFVGADGESGVAGQAAAWSLARRVVVSSKDPGLEELDYSVSKLATLTWQLASALSENSVRVDELLNYSSKLSSVGELPLGGRGVFEKELRAITQGAKTLPTLLRLVEEFQLAKDQRGLVEFSDQVRLALQVVTAHPMVVRQLRDRYRVVLLDEYQDTSVMQTRLLATLFADHPVMAVGDPHQAIYGWRGAGAANLADFPHAFAGEYACHTFGLQLSWRNSERILSASNALARPLGETTGAEVGQLSAREGAPVGEIEWLFPDTLSEEAEQVAAWFAKRLQGAKPAPSAALLLRTRAHQEIFAKALTDKGVPVHILGIGGLLADPVVADIVCALSVVHRAQANAELVRLLTSGRFLIGAADLWKLSRVAASLTRRERRSSVGANPSAEDEQGNEAFSLVDAIDLSTVRGDVLAGLSPSAKQQLTECAEILRRARLVAHEPLVDQVSWWMRELCLDIEIVANPARRSSHQARDALLEAIDRYESLSVEGGASGFLDWLEHAEWRDGLSPQSEPAEPGCVQILTIHGAKGLEWDIVALGRLVEGELPGKPRDGLNAWLAPGHLPYPFRADASHLPRFAWEEAGTRKELVNAYQEFRDDVSRFHRQEERRLAYVALTRAKSALLLSGSFWSGGKTPREPSAFLLELEEEGAVGPLPRHPNSLSAPEEQHDEMSWPGDPLGSRRAEITRAAETVSAVSGRAPRPNNSLVMALDQAMARERRAGVSSLVTWPIRIPASQFDRWVNEPEVMLASRATPRPSTIGLAQQQGTTFHEWVEDYFQEAGRGRLVADIDFDGALDQPATADLALFQEAFRSSVFAEAVPLALEREIHLPLAGHLIICKLDAVFNLDGVVHIVDWKTGAPPKNDEDAARRSLQLALYRLAWAEWTGDDPEAIRALLWFAKTGDTLQPEHLSSREELEAMVKAAKAKTSLER